MYTMVYNIYNRRDICMRSVCKKEGKKSNTKRPDQMGN